MENIFKMLKIELSKCLGRSLKEGFIIILITGSIMQGMMLLIYICLLDEMFTSMALFFFHLFINLIRYDGDNDRDIINL